MANTFRGKNFAATPAMEDVKVLLGAALSADWRQALVACGKAWHADSGAFSTPGAGGGASAVIDQDRPNMLISIPQGLTLVPLRIHAVGQVPILAADSDEAEIVIAVDTLAAAAGIGAATTAVTPLNMRTGSNLGGCPATVYKTLSANITNPTLTMELAHAVIVGDVQGIATSTTWERLEVLYAPTNPPFLTGPCAIYIYHGGTVATTGFINADFAVVDTSLISGLTYGS